MVRRHSPRYVHDLTPVSLLPLPLTCCSLKGPNVIAWLLQIFLSGCSVPLFLSLAARSRSRPSLPTSHPSPSPCPPTRPAVSPSPSFSARAPSPALKVFTCVVFTVNLVAAALQWAQTYLYSTNQVQRAIANLPAMPSRSEVVVGRASLVIVALVAAMVQGFYAVRLPLL